MNGSISQYYRDQSLKTLRSFLVFSLNDGPWDLLMNLRPRKKWIVLRSERPITICAIVKGWTQQGFLIWHIRVRSKGTLRPIIYITEKSVHQHHLSMHRARLLGRWFKLACSGWPAGFISTYFLFIWAWIKFKRSTSQSPSSGKHPSSIS